MLASDYRKLAYDSRIAYTRPMVWRIDAPRAIVSGRMQSWAERLNRMIFASRSWAGMETIERRQAKLLANRRVRCEVYEANNR
jgi:hypothetical protein